MTDYTLSIPALARILGQAFPDPPPKPKKVIKPVSERTKVEYERLLQLIKTTCVISESGFVDNCTVEGVYHPRTQLEWLAALHMVATKFTTMTEVARLMERSPALVGQRYRKRSRRLRGCAVRGLITEDQIVI